jgi:crotonobetainyl-CoA:carnitine CoA-transferase CaiB-like acyl-CoA transferase
VSFSDVGGRRYAPVPLLGQHTAEVLAELADRTGAPPARS